MSDKIINVLNVTLDNLEPTAKKLIIAPEGKLQTETEIALESNFNINNALALIGNAKCIGIADADRFDEAQISKLINILTSKNKAIVVEIRANPIGCRVFYPEPQIGEKYICGNYEYSYNQRHVLEWSDCHSQNGWGTKILDKSQSDYIGPLTMIKGKPVTSTSYLFAFSPISKFNLIDWDTSNIIDMEGMFVMIKADALNLSSFNTTKVKNMMKMFHKSKMLNLNLESFQITEKTSTRNMFFRSEISRVKAKSQSEIDMYKESLSALPCMTQLFS